MHDERAQGGMKMFELAILNGLALVALVILPTGGGRRPREDRRLAKEVLRRAYRGHPPAQEVPDGP